MTTTEAEKRLMTDRVLEHSIFSNRPIYVMVQNEPDKKVSFFVEEILKDCFVAEISPENLTQIKHKSLMAKNLQVVIGHKNQAFIFPSKLMDSFEIPSDRLNKKGHFFFSKPHTGILQNQRTHSHFSLGENSFYLKAELKIASKLGDFTFETRHLVDMSHTSLALFLDRAQGLVLPGDKIKSLTLYRQNEIVLETEGTIFRTDMKRVSEQIGNSYFAVIQLAKDPLPSPGPFSDKSGALEGVRIHPSKAFVEAEHPILKGYQFSGEIQYLSTSNVSFSIEKKDMPLVTGLILNDIHINIPPNDLNLKACIKITYCALEETSESKRFLVFGKFLGMSIDLIKVVNRLKDNLVDLRLVEAKREDFEQLMEFFFESGFIYSAKRKQLQKYAASIRQTNMKLLESNGPIVKKVIFKDENVIKGHISSIRFFDRTWLIHHMTTHNSPGTAIARAILKSISNFFLDSSSNLKANTKFVTCYFQPTNLYPEMVFGEFKRMVANPDICDMTDLDVCVLAAEEGFKAEKIKTKAKCYEAKTEDLVNLERLLVAQKLYFLIRVEGLTAEAMTKLEVSAEYEKIGLYRRRRVFVAKHPEDGEIVYAVCNYSSPGCNLSELTNSFRFYYSGKDSKNLSDLINALSRHVLASYQETEMQAPVLLLDEGQPMPNLFKKIRRYRYWFLDTAHVDIFMSITESILSNAKEILKRMKSRNAVSDKIDSEKINSDRTYAKAAQHEQV
jgi:hypothetical protein